LRAPLEKKLCYLRRAELLLDSSFHMKFIFVDGAAVLCVGIDGQRMLELLLPHIFLGEFV